MSATVFVHRIYFFRLNKTVFSSENMTKIGTLHCIFLFIIFFHFFSHTFHFWAFTVLSFLIFPISLFLLIKSRQSQFYSEFLRFLSMVILRMQMGSGFRTAWEECLDQGQWRQERLLHGIYSNVVFSPQELPVQRGYFHEFINKIIEELREVRSSPHQGLDRLQKFRDDLVQDLFFRQKSRSVWRHMMSQWFLLSLFNGLIAFYVGTHFGWQQNKNIFLMSFAFYLFGVALLLIQMRRKKWPI